MGETANDCGARVTGSSKLAARGQGQGRGKDGDHAWAGSMTPRALAHRGKLL